MLLTFARAARELRSMAPIDIEHLPDDVLWLDLHEPSPEELRTVERRLGIEMPTREEMREIEASARVYEEGGALYLTSTLLFQADTLPPRTTEVSFILKGERLVTMRFTDPQPFRSMGGRIERYGPTLTTAQACSSGCWTASSLASPTSWSVRPSTSTSCPTASSGRRESREGGKAGSAGSAGAHRPQWRHHGQDQREPAHAPACPSRRRRSPIPCRSSAARMPAQRAKALDARRAVADRPAVAD